MSGVVKVIGVILAAAAAIFAALGVMGACGVRPWDEAPPSTTSGQ